MLKLSLIGSVLIAITILIHAYGTATWVRYLAAKHMAALPWSAGRAMLLLVGSAIVVVFLHALEIVVWAKAYQFVLPANELATIEEAVYFSFVTFTTLGYGDITLSEGFRVLSGIQALNGIILVGWSTAMIFSVVQHVWRGLTNNVASDD
jgi:TRAP-type C4-dicarboxylate transport system permease small subunit